MKDELVNTISNWEIFYYISTYVLACIAIFGFIFSQKTSNKVSSALMIMEKSLSSLSFPMVKLTDYMFEVENVNSYLSESNPPVGLIIEYSNVSNIPIRIIKSKYRLFYGDKELNEPSTPIGTMSEKPFIMSPGDVKQSGIRQKTLLIRYLGKPKNIALPPHLNLKLEIEFETFDNIKWMYNVHREIHFDIADPRLKSWKTLEENIEKI